MLVEEAGSVFFTDVRYDTQAHDEVKAAKVVIANKAVLQALADWMGGRRKRAGDGQSALSPSTSPSQRRSA